MAAPQALVIGHSPTAGLRRLGPWFSQSGLDYQVVFGGDGLPAHLDDYAALLVLGGAPLPNDDERFPWLPDTRKLTGEALERGIPFLGICLGGQLLAYVAGGTVEHRKLKPEHGMTDIILDAPAAKDPLFKVMPERFPMTENHVDHITKLPRDAALLAHSQRSPVQGFRIGACAWGLQFHPEISSENIASWDDGDRRGIERDGYNWNDLMARAQAQTQENARLAERFGERFAAICLASA